MRSVSITTLNLDVLIGKPNAYSVAKAVTQFNFLLNRGKLSRVIGPIKTNKVKKIVSINISIVFQDYQVVFGDIKARFVEHIKN